jgi:drug/metabolite transporter (DMT)-like permease
MKLSIPVVVLLFSSIGWGLTWLPLRYFDSVGLAGPLMIFIAFFSAVVFLLPLLVKGKKSNLMNGLHLLLLIALFGGLANLSFQTALYYGDVVRVMILFYLLPIWSVLGGRIFLGERIDALRLLTLAAALAGGVLILGGTGVLSRPPDLIDLLAVLSGFSFAMNNLVFRFAQSIPLINKVIAMFIGVVVFIGLFLVFNSETLKLPSLQTTILAMGYGIVWLSLITIGTQWGVTRLEAGRASIIIVMELVAAVVSAVLILGQPLALAEFTGAVLVVAAALLEGFRTEQDTVILECRENA